MFITLLSSKCMQGYIRMLCIIKLALKFYSTEKIPVKICLDASFAKWGAPLFRIASDSTK